jgi:hypothetical protein
MEVMRLRGNTSTDDWNPITLLWLIWHEGYRCYECGYSSREWRLGFMYTWYDGPIWQFEVGPFWVAIGYW